MALSKPSIDKYLTEKLKWPTWEKVLQFDEVKFLQTLIRKFVVNIYFQNVSFLASDTTCRHVPTLDEIAEGGLTGKGGGCMANNWFLKLLLDALGYDVFCVGGSFVGAPPRTHVMTVVRFDTELYLVDVGSAQPLHEAIPLHDLPFRRGVAGHSYEYRQLTEDGQYVRYQVGAGLFYEVYPEDDLEKVRYEFDLTPQEYEEFPAAMNVMWRDENVSLFIRNLVLFRHMDPDEESDTLPPTGSDTDLRFVLVFGTYLLMADAKRKVLLEHQTYAELRPYVDKYFPELDKDEVDRVFTELSKYDPMKPMAF